MNENHWFQVSISGWRLETISINVDKTPVECFEYAVAPRRRPPRYHDRFNAVFPMLLPFVSPTRPQSSCYKTAHRTPRNTTTYSISIHPSAGKLATCQHSAAICSAASCCPEALWIQLQGYIGVCATGLPAVVKVK